MRAKPAQLILKSGEVFDGEAFGYTKEKVGELVFNTSMTGYQEIITDLSYTDQLICFTYPHIGNVGTNIDDHESAVGGASGVVIRDLTRVESNWRNELSLADFLNAHKDLLANDVILISDTGMISRDTPSITTGLRGLSYVEVEVTGPNRDLHSGIYGGAVLNPINGLPLSDISWMSAYTGPRRSFTS